MPNNLCVFVNPNAGTGYGLQWYNIFVEQVNNFECNPVLVTSEKNQIYNFAKNNTMEILSSFAVIIFGGDGTVYEYLNGIFNSEVQNDNFIHFPPLLVFPTGSGNSLATNLNLIQLRDNVATSFNSLNVKNIPIWTITHDNNSIFSILSQTYGIIADIDLSTEWLRTIGDKRYILGTIWSILFPKYYKIDCEIIRQNDQKIYIKGEILLFCASTVPFITEKMVITSMAKIDEELIDIIYVQDRLSLFQRIKLVQDLFGGNFSHNKWIKYYKAKSYHLKTDAQNKFMVDGEVIEASEVDVSLSKHYLPCYSK